MEKISKKNLHCDVQWMCLSIKEDFVITLYQTLDNNVSKILIANFDKPKEWCVHEKEFILISGWRYVLFYLLI